MGMTPRLDDVPIRPFLSGFLTFLASHNYMNWRFLKFYTMQSISSASYYKIIFILFRFDDNVVMTSNKS